MKKLFIIPIMAFFITTKVIANTYYCPQTITCDKNGVCTGKGAHYGTFQVVYRTGKYNPRDKYVFREARFLDYMEMNWTCDYTNNYASPTSYLDIKSTIPILPDIKARDNKWVNANVWGGEHYCHYNASHCPFTDA